MIHDVLSVRPDDSLAEVAGLLIDKHIHRVPVVEDDRLVGMVSSLDFVRLFAEGKARPS
jgi:CBS domain-containing protein